MVRILDLPSLDSDDITAALDYLLVTGTAVPGPYQAAKVSIQTLSDHYNNTGALNATGVQNLVDSNYIFTAINSSTDNTLTAPGLTSWSNVTSKPTSISGFGILDAISVNNFNIVTNSPSSTGSISFTPVSSTLTYTPPLLPNINDSTGALAEGTNLYYTEARVTGLIDSAYVLARSSAQHNSTTSLAEGTNLYHTTARVRSAISATGSLSYDSGTGIMSFSMPAQTTTAITEGTNLYFTGDRVVAIIDSDYVASRSSAVSFGELTNVPTTISGYGITDAMTASAITTAIDTAIQTKDNTDEMTEGSTNLYHTLARVRASISATGSLSYNNSTGVISFTQGNTDTVTEGSTNLYYTDARVDSNITGSDLNMGSNDIITTGKSLYANMYSTEGNLPSASTYHGMFAHVHGTGKGYFSHGGSWHKLVDETNLSTQVDSAYVLARSPAGGSGVDSSLILNSITDPKYLRSDISDSGVSLSLSSTLHAAGAITSDGDITAFNSASDRKLKENIEVIDNAIDKVMTLSGYTFNYIGREEKMSGVMADEVESVLPEVVYEFDGEYKAVRYGNMMGLIIEAIKDLKSDINELKEKIN